MAWYLRACPHCGVGDLYDSDDDPGYVICFQCSREFEKLVKNKQVIGFAGLGEVEKVDEEG